MIHTLKLAAKCVERSLRTRQLKALWLASEENHLYRREEYCGSSRNVKLVYKGLLCCIIEQILKHSSRLLPTRSRYSEG